MADTGLDMNSCFFREDDGDNIECSTFSSPVFDLTKRKVTITTTNINKLPRDAVHGAALTTSQFKHFGISGPYCIAHHAGGPTSLPIQGRVPTATMCAIIQVVHRNVGVATDTGRLSRILEKTSLAADPLEVFNRRRRISPRFRWSSILDTWIARTTKTDTARTSAGA